MEALLENDYGHNQSDLQVHQESILASFRQQAPLTRNEALTRIKALPGLTRSPTSVGNWMHKNGLKFVKMGHLPAKADVVKQAQWLEKQLNPVIEKAQKGECHLFFIDAAHLVLNPFLCGVCSVVCAVWCVQCGVCSVVCAVWCVQCGVCSVVFNPLVDQSPCWPTAFKCGGSFARHYQTNRYLLQ